MKTMISLAFLVFSSVYCVGQSNRTQGATVLQNQVFIKPGTVLNNSNNEQKINHLQGSIKVTNPYQNSELIRLNFLQKSMTTIDGMMVVPLPVQGQAPMPVKRPDSEFHSEMPIKGLTPQYH